MTDRPWMPFWMNDYLGKTMHLTTKEHGAYLLLILHYWQHGGLPNQDATLREICKVSAHEWSKIKITLKPFFEMPDWRHNRIDEELLKYYDKRRKRQNAGRKGAYKSNLRWLTIGSANAAAKGQHLPRHIVSNASPIIKKDTKEEDIDKKQNFKIETVSEQLLATMRSKEWI